MKTKKRIKRTFSPGITRKYRSEYTTWLAMLGRCNNESNKAFLRYGGRGIWVCKEWNIFDKFIEDMGPRPLGKSLDRIDNNSGYTKENCRWGTRSEQQNNRRNNHIIDFNNQRKTLTQWARELGICSDTLKRRIALGWPIEEAFGAPLIFKPTETKRWKASRQKIGKHFLFRGKTQNISAWAREFNILPQMVYQRLDLGWSLEKALTTPKTKNSGNYGKRKTA